MTRRFTVLAATAQYSCFQSQQQSAPSCTRSCPAVSYPFKLCERRLCSLLRLAAVWDTSPLSQSGYGVKEREAEHLKAVGILRAIKPRRRQGNQEGDALAIVQVHLRGTHGPRLRAYGSFSARCAWLVFWTASGAGVGTGELSGRSVGRDPYAGTHEVCLVIEMCQGAPHCCKSMAAIGLRYTPLAMPRNFPHCSS